MKQLASTGISKVERTSHSATSIHLCWLHKGKIHSVAIYPLSPWDIIPDTSVGAYRYAVGHHIDIQWLAEWRKTCGLSSSVTTNRCVNDGPILVVDTERHCVVESTLSSTYACLSYVWGQTDLCRLTKNNISQYSSPAEIPKDDISRAQVIEDAINISR
ncbi:hypothetical protein QBC38DRAFT_65981 [Podospora fimiseda]|uniref:Heterokaryon incompatibility domain-containing protein n=1 Tax=Podospora fimiseda TaxID=252190 RepID=A0AAN6YQN2_9PEZI|nr:hypothetical protein QBC38DRAFT_65981 [Podospora fimiseda]